MSSIAMKVCECIFPLWKGNPKFGLKLTKVGYSGESEPRHIIPTPEFLLYEKYMKEDTKKHIEAREFDQNNLEERMLFQVIKTCY